MPRTSGARGAAGLALLLACLLFASGCDKPAPAVRFHATPLEAPAFGEDIAAFHLKDPDGREHRLSDWRGKVVLIFFGYTQCPDVCPTALARAAEMQRLLGPDAERVQVLFVTLDPARDTPELLREYPRAFHPSFLGLYTTPAETPALAKAFRVFYRINPGRTPTSYTIDHSVTTYAYDPEGHLRLAIGHAQTAAEMAEDVRALLASPTRASAPKG
jgi:protein SCO1/2